MSVERTLHNLFESVGIKPEGKDFGLVVQSVNNRLEVDDTWMSRIVDSYTRLRTVGSMAVGGSHAFGLNDENSDVDLMAVIYPAAIDYQRNMPSLEQVTTKTCDISFHDVRSFVSGVMIKGPSMNHMTAIYSDNRVDDGTMVEIYQLLAGVLDMSHNIIVKNLFWTAHNLYRSVLADNNARSRDNVLEHHLMPVKSARKVHARIYHLCEWASYIHGGGDTNPNTLPPYVYETYRWMRTMDDPRRSFGLAREAVKKLSAGLGVNHEDSGKIELPLSFHDLCNGEQNAVFESSHADGLTELLLEINHAQLDWGSYDPV